MEQARAILDSYPEHRGNTVFVKPEYRYFRVDKSYRWEYSISFFLGPEDGACESAVGKTIQEALKGMKEKLVAVANNSD